MTVRAAAADADFFVLRAPLLAVDTLERWVEDARAPAACAAGADDAALDAALAADRRLLRARLDALLADPQIADALALASPDLADAVDRSGDVATKGARSTERSLVRYVTRLASRPDLFGLAGAYATGSFARDARLDLAPRERLDVRAQLDSGLLRDVVRRAAAESAEDPALVVRRNPAAYRAAGQLRVAARVPGTTKHRLRAMRPTAAIECALDAAGAGAPVGEVVAALVAAGLAPERARAVVGRLIAGDLLVALADVAVTGPEPAEQAAIALDVLPAGRRYAPAVRRAAEAVARGGGSAARATIDEATRALGAAGVEVGPRRCLQVDSRRSGETRLPPRALHELRRAVDLLARVTPAAPPALAAFRDAFELRFGTRAVPLLVALDPDVGIRLDPMDGLGPPPPDPGAARRRRALLGLLDRGRPGGTVELTDADIAALARSQPGILPGAFSVITSLLARDAAAVAAGDFQLVEPRANGPSGGRLLGRLCRGDEELAAHVREHLRREAATDPDTVFAELSIAPETPAGLNVTQRPLLREWEIEYGGGSGAPADRRLDPADLLVSVDYADVVLHSQRLGRRIIPSCTTAMNGMWVSLPAARFLLSLAQQGVSGNLGWEWDELGDAPALPRVTHGRTILALARWNVAASELAGAGTDAAGFRRLARWRAERGVPRRVAFDHPKSRILVDFDNVLSVDAFLAATRGLGLLRLVEATAAEPSPVHGPDGRYAHELVVPFTLPPASARSRARRPTTPVREEDRRFAPGTEWLHANLYGPAATADRVLLDHVAPLADRLRADGVVDRWFFIRYADPQRHLRVRFHGRPGELLATILPALHDAIAGPLRDGTLHRVSLDTYEREIERYGGLEGVALMEAVAEADSDAAVALLRARPAADERRLLTVASVAALYADAALPLAVRRGCCEHLRTVWARGRPLGALLAGGERADRAAVAAIVGAVESGDGDGRLAALHARSERLRPVLASLRGLEEAGTLEEPLDSVMSSLAHMAVNRLLTRGANHDELRVHDALARLYVSRAARGRAATPEAVGA